MSIILREIDSFYIQADNENSRLELSAILWNVIFLNSDIMFFQTMTFNYATRRYDGILAVNAML